MSKLLNKEIAVMEPDRLIYDSKYPTDGKVVKIKLTAGTAGTLKRGQILDYDGDNECYQVHAADGTVGAVLSENVLYSEDVTEVFASVYISGSFLQAACVTDVELTAADLETFRGKGIYLK